MRKSILGLTAIFAAAVIGQTVAADARNGRGFGMGSFNGGGLSPLADPTILAGVAATQRRAEARRRGIIISTPTAVSRQYDAGAAEIAARKREAAAKAKADRLAAAREAREAALRKAQAAKAAKSVSSKVAAPTKVEQSSTVGTGQGLQSNQAAQLLKTVDRPAASPAPKSAATPAAAAATDAKQPATGDCKRFVPGAGITVSVSCTE